MLTRTEDVLARHGIDSIAELEQRLYEELGDANLLDVLDHAVSNIFANASKCITVISVNGASTNSNLTLEQQKIMHGRVYGRSHDNRIPIANIHNTGMLYVSPAFVEVHRNGRAVFSKTLLGQLIGDVFAVQGIHAGADPELEDSMSSLFGYSPTSHSINSPLASMLVLEWAAEGSETPSIRELVRKTGLANHDMRAYKSMTLRLSRAAHRLAEKGFIIYESRHPDEFNVYTAVDGGSASSEVPYYIGKEFAGVVRSALSRRKMTISQTAGYIHYGEAYTRAAISWLADQGFVEIVKGMPNRESSAVLPTKKSERLHSYMHEPLELVGFSLNKKNAALFRTPRINVSGLVEYRQDVVDAVLNGTGFTKVFLEECREAYAKHVTRYGRNVK